MPLPKSHMPYLSISVWGITIKFLWAQQPMSGHKSQCIAHVKILPCDQLVFGVTVGNESCDQSWLQGNYRQKVNGADYGWERSQGLCFPLWAVGECPVLEFIIRKFWSKILWPVVTRAQSPEDCLIYIWPWVQSPAPHKLGVVVHTCQHLRGGSRRIHSLKSSFDYLESSRSTWVPWNLVSRTSIYHFLCIF